MRILNSSNIALVVVGLLGLTGCTVRHGDFSVVSNKLIDVNNFDLGSTSKAKHVVGKDLSHIIVLFPTGLPTLEGAIDAALLKGEGDVVTNAVVSSGGWYIPYIYGQNYWIVEGDVVKTRPK
jgi:hypothetical protein